MCHHCENSRTASKKPNERRLPHLLEDLVDVDLEGLDLGLALLLATGLGGLGHLLRGLLLCLGSHGCLAVLTKEERGALPELCCARKCEL